MSDPLDQNQPDSHPVRLHYPTLSRRLATSSKRFYHTESKKLPSNMINVFKVMGLF